MRAERVGATRCSAQIVHMVAQAQRTRAPIQRSADTVAGWFVPAVIAIAIVTFVVVGLLRARAAPGLRAGQRRGGADHRLPLRARTGHADVDHGRRGPRRAERHPVKNAEALEKLEKVDTLVVDKTGTLTAGQAARDAYRGCDGLARRTLLRIAAASSDQRASARRRDRGRREAKRL